MAVIGDARFAGRDSRRRELTTVNAARLRVR
jgi:hypothetical protein